MRFEAIRSSGPIIRRELVALLWSRKAFLTAVATVALAGLVPLLSWPEPGAPAAAIHARNGFQAYRVAFAAAMALFTAVASASAITVEKENGTWDLLVASPFPVAGIIVGKLVSHLAFFLILIATTFPVASLLFLLGGFTAGEMAVTLASMACMTACIGALGLNLSHRNERTSRAVIPTVLLGSYFFGIFAASSDSWGGLLILAAIILHFTIRRESVGLRPEPASPPLFVRSRRPRYREPRSLWPVTRILRGSREGIPDRWNPALVLSAQNPLIRALGAPDVGWAILAWYVVVVILAGLVVYRLNMVVAFTTILMGSAAFIFPGLAAVLLGAEREMDRLDHLRTTPLRARTVMRGKLAAVLLSGILVPILGTLVFPFLILDPKAGVLSIPLYFHLAAPAVGLVTATAGLLGAALSRTTLQALVISYLLAGAYLVGPVIGEALVGQAGMWPSPLTGYLWNGFQVARDSGSHGWGEMAASIAVALIVAMVQLRLAELVFERRWLRSR